MRRRTRSAEDAATDQAISRLLERGESNLAVMRELGVGYSRVRGVRDRKKLPAFQRGRKPSDESWEDALAARILATGDGHAHWTGNCHPDNGTPILHHRSRKTTAARAVFEQHYGRPPVGNVQQTCDYPHCVKGEHLADRAMREEAAGRVAA
ncbi:hypothetical protein SUDANB1_05585 [Streptomyces sp. enrichment culture]|uniref:hypothetical protein n=1 Tax=Streptomyces sp. enrichment culture TaxID=1795815 RepID=UPI003F579E11